MNLKEHLLNILDRAKKDPDAVIKKAKKVNRVKGRAGNMGHELTLELDPLIVINTADQVALAEKITEKGEYEIKERIFVQLK